jgi:hypothetical protein
VCPTACLSFVVEGQVEVLPVGVLLWEVPLALVLHVLVLHVLVPLWRVPLFLFLFAEYFYLEGFGME